MSIANIPSDNIAFIGMAGSGKTAIGRTLANKLQRTFIDTDEMIEKSVALSIADIMLAKGEAHFRKLESTALAEALAAPKCVIATGGGAILSDKNRRLLRGAARVVYLSSSATLLQRRLSGETTTRPLLQGDDWKQRVKQLLQEREHLYQQTAHLVIVLHGEDTPDDIAERTLAGLRGMAGEAAQ